MRLELGAVFRDHAAPIWRFVSARVPISDAEDVTSEVFERATKAWDRYDPSRGSVGAWLSGIARHGVADYWRRRSGTPVPEGEVDVGAWSDPEGSAISGEQRSLLAKQLQLLSDREREALALRFGAELRPAEVGSVLGISEAAAKMLVHRAVTKLRGAMADE